MCVYLCMYIQKYFCCQKKLKKIFLKGLKVYYREQTCLDKKFLYEWSRDTFFGRDKLKTFVIFFLYKWSRDTYLFLAKDLFHDHKRNY